ncbi:MAG: RpiB/LacA/LacB family sugar-phosphate isomerase [Acidimicrobiia bacterium]|nr:RpiB/LacA/LacB family sugar-phosphate isomerase [Acidimicrobiia bacterium]
MAVWTDVGREVAESVVRGDADVGVVCCWTGTGVSMAANKVDRAAGRARGHAETARGARRWNDADVLAMSLRLTSETVADEMLDAFFEAAPDPDELDIIRQLP